jgi:hypothetical protein
MIGRSKPRGIHVLALLIGVSGVMDLQNLFWFFIDPARALGFKTTRHLLVESSIQRSPKRRTDNV